MEKTITIADALLILMTLIGPIAAVQAQKWIERTRELRNRKLWIFHTLMATRAVRASSPEHVQALNLIELFFDGKGAKDRAVTASWKLYRDHLMYPLPQNMNDTEARVHNEKGAIITLT